MIQVFIPTDAGFNLYENEIKNLYENLQGRICDNNSFDFVKNNTLFYMFVIDGMLLGGIYYFKDSEKLFVNAFSKRKFLKEKLACLKLSLSWFKCDIYAEAQHKETILCLLRLKFKHYKNNIFVYRQNEG